MEKTNKLPSAHQVGDKVSLNLFESGSINNCEVIGVKFKESKVYYDIAVLLVEAKKGGTDVNGSVIEDDEAMYTVLEGVDSVCVVRPSYFEYTRRLAEKTNRMIFNTSEKYIVGQDSKQLTPDPPPNSNKEINTNLVTEREVIENCLFKARQLHFNGLTPSDTDVKELENELYDRLFSYRDNSELRPYNRINVLSSQERKMSMDDLEEELTKIVFKYASSHMMKKDLELSIKIMRDVIRHPQFYLI